MAETSSPIFLIGYMASGKTTLGVAVAREADAEFIDLDEAVERSAGMTVSEIFARDGEEAFRRLESETLATICASNQAKQLIVACGGGTPCHSDNMDRMLEMGTVVWLDARRDILLKRLEEAQATRPLVAGKSRKELERFVDENLRAREPHYSRAHLRFDSSELDTPDEITATVTRFLNILQQPPIPNSQFPIPNSQFLIQKMSSPTPLEQPCEVLTDKHKISIGLPAASSAGERRFPLTPEGAAMLCERGFEVRMESGAAESIHFSDDAYRRGGVRIVDRREAFACDIVVHLPAVALADARQMRTGAVLMSLLHADHQTPEALRCLLRRHVIALALDQVADDAGHLPFADILSEIDGRAAMAMASSLLADPVHGKGILLGGVAGIVPCEVTIIGSDIAARAAARSALGMGATVRMFDNDVYRLRDALHELGDSQVIGSALHPRVFAGALRSADVVIATPTRYPIEIGVDIVDEMKRGVIAFDLAHSAASCLFPSLQCIDLAGACASDCSPRAQVRTCYVNAGSAVPRTAAMALSTTLLTLFDDIIVCDGLSNALKFNKGLSRAAYTFLGKPVNPEIARILGTRSLDISLFLQFS